jgi:hypothetical protein
MVMWSDVVCWNLFRYSTNKLLCCVVLCCVVSCCEVSCSEVECRVVSEPLSLFDKQIVVLCCGVM